MSIRLHWLRDQGVGLTVYQDRITPEALMAHIRAIDPAGAPTAKSWITYFDDSVDVSELGIETFLCAREAVAAKLRAARGAAPLRTALVCRSRLNRPNLSLWRACLSADPEHPMQPVLFESVKEACDWLGLPTEARWAVTAAIGGQADAVPATGPEPRTAKAS